MNAPASGRASIGRQFWPPATSAVQIAIHDGGDLSGIAGAPMVKAVRCGFPTGEMIQFHDLFHRRQHRGMQAVLVRVIGQRDRGHDIEPHIAGHVQRIAAWLIQVAQHRHGPRQEYLFEQTFCVSRMFVDRLRSITRLAGAQQ